ncbi:MAG TPA: arginine--tRNA ligase [Aliicoccus persicus]|uniref:Arginine--tRNA ligase n=1 Tax=Aliicoccus persicus TaxID=930138 RepID=A0A921DVF0_9STAP|nr:arginine--tRNA ligase [Aliicoccus persicus]
MKDIIASELHRILKEHMTLEEILETIEIPADTSHGDFSFPTFKLAKIMRQAPPKIAANIADEFDSSTVDEVKVIGGFLNFHLAHAKVAKSMLQDIISEDFGTSASLRDKTYVIDFSSPNIAKPFSMGHFRATILGDALQKILRQNSAKVIGINHLGDWGTQFGKLIVAYQMWGDEEAVRSNPIPELFKLYVRINAEEKENPTLADKGREAFSKLEQGDPEMHDLWFWFRTVSLDAFDVLYQRLNIHFDVIQGEAFYNDSLEHVSELLEEKKLLELDDGAYIVPIEDMPPALIKKRDGSSLYITRDIAAVLYRKEHYNPDHILYVVGHEQSVHFNQLREVIKKMEIDVDIEHIAFGLILKDGKKMSTRSGQVLLLEDIIDEVKARVLEVMDEKGTTIVDKDQVAEKLAIGALKYHDLKPDRNNSYSFNIDDMVSFEGDTAVYINYTNARIQSILRKRERNIALDSFNYEESMWPLINHLSTFPSVLENAASKYSPSLIARYVMQLCRHFNAYYGNTRIVSSVNVDSQMFLLDLVSKNIVEAFRLLGIEVVDAM